MRKSCYICKHSVVVTYTRIMCNNQKYKKEELFCIAAPPGTKNKFIWGSVGKGYRELIKHRGYPVVSNVAPCSLYSLTNNKKKIEKYNIQLEKEKQEKEDKKEKILQKKLLLQEQKEKKKKKEQQKAYRARKKAEKIEAEKKANKYNRFEIMDI